MLPASIILSVLVSVGAPCAYYAVERASLQRNGEAGWPLRVEMIEMLGAERLVYGRVGDELFTVRVDGTLAAPQPGDMLSVRMDAKQLHWFDAASSQRVP